MRMTLRWYGPADPVSIAYIRQIPGVLGIVSAVEGVAAGDPWTHHHVNDLAVRIADAGLTWDVVESIPVSEEIKLGSSLRDRHIDAWCESLRQVAHVGVPVVCYNFMPVFDWMRTDLAHRLPDHSTTLLYDHAQLRAFDLSRGTGELPGWGARYDASALRALIARWKSVDESALWDNLAYFLERVVPVAAEHNVKLGIHPDDPPWSIFGLPRIVVNREALDRLLGLVDNPANGLTFCTGSLGASASNNLPAMIREFGGRGRIHFMHCRNVKRSGEQDFCEVPHPSSFGDVPMNEVVRALRDVQFEGPVRPDHGRMIWGETGRAGYGLYDRALGAMYLQGLWEGMST